MARVCPELKEALVADGRWREFNLRRDEFLKGGAKPSDALNMAIVSVCPEWADKASVAGGRKNVSKVVDAAESAADRIEKLVDRKAKRDASRPGRLGLGDLSKLPDSFWKRKCSTSEAFWWALKKAKLGVGEVEDAPGEKALVLYSLFMDSPDATVDVSRQVLTKLIAKDDGDDSGSGRFDGEAEYDILKNLSEGEA